VCASPDSLKPTGSSDATERRSGGAEMVIRVELSAKRFSSERYQKMSFFDTPSIMKVPSLEG